MGNGLCVLRTDANFSEYLKLYGWSVLQVHRHRGRCVCVLCMVCMCVVHMYVVCMH